MTNEERMMMAVSRAPEAAVEVIAKFLGQWDRLGGQGIPEKAARILLAQLANHKPSILVGFAEEFKE